MFDQGKGRLRFVLGHISQAIFESEGLQKTQRKNITWLKSQLTHSKSPICIRNS